LARDGRLAGALAAVGRAGIRHVCCRCCLGLFHISYGIRILLRIRLGGISSPRAGRDQITGHWRSSHLPSHQSTWMIPTPDDMLTIPRPARRRGIDTWTQPRGDAGRLGKVLRR